MKRRLDEEERTKVWVDPLSTPFGATEDREAVEQTWSFFVDRRLKTWDGFPLYYYGTEAPLADSTEDSTGLLLANHDGDCDSFAWLLYDALRVNAVRGIALSHVYPAPGNDALAVKAIAFNEPGTFPIELYYKYARSDLDVSPAGLAGQNMDPPREKRFYYHRVIHWATDQSYLDPSYGTPFQTEAQYAEKIDAWGKGRGYYWRKASGSLLNPVFSDD